MQRLDKLAGAALANDSPEMHVAVHEVRQEFAAWIVRLKKVYAYFVDLDRWSINWKKDSIGDVNGEGSDKGKTDSAQAAVDKFRHVQKLLSSWKVTDPLIIPLGAREDDLFRAIPAGQKIASCLALDAHTQMAEA